MPKCEGSDRQTSADVPPARREKRSNAAGTQLGLSQRLTSAAHVPFLAEV